LDVEITITPPSDLSEAEAAVAEAEEGLRDAQRATRAAESLLLTRQAEEADAQQAYDRAAEGIRDLYVAERQRLEEAARLAETALRELDHKLGALRTETGADPEGEWYETLREENEDGLDATG
jgi:multidrug resistance efflux pump